MRSDNSRLEFEKRRKEMQAKYGMVFREGFGREVLADILLDLCHFGVTLDPDNKVQVAEYNVGMVIAKRAGVLEAIGTHILGITKGD